MAPVTRSTGKGRSLAQLISEAEGSATEGAPSSQAAEATADNTASQTVTSETTPPLSQESTDTPLTSRPLAPPPTKSVKTTSSQRARRIAKARKEILRIELELARASLAAIEAEDDSEDDNATVLSATLIDTRVGAWLELSHREVLATTQEPQFPEEHPVIIGAPVPPPPPSDAAEFPPPLRAAAAAAVPAAPAQSPDAPSNTVAPVFTPAPPCAPRREEATVASIVKKPAQQVDISELATAIASAARAGSAPRFATELPAYGGSQQEWLSFKATYEESCARFTEIENIGRLRRALKGRAQEAVENLLLYQAPADDIMKTLETRFGRPDSIALAELERLRALPRLTDSARDICAFSCRVANTIATLRALDRAQYLLSPEATKAILDKLTTTQRYRWYDFAATTTNAEPELIKVSAFLQREAQYCAAYAQPEVAEAPTSVRRPHKTFTTIEKPVSKCSCCQSEAHDILKCPKFAAEEVDNRWKIAKEKRLCFRCLKYKNKTHYCKRIKCEQDGCEYFHHKLLHSKKPEPTVSEAVASTWTPRQSRAFLKIMPVTIEGPKGQVSTLALFDDGSTITLLSEDIARRAGLDGPAKPLQIEAITNEKINATNSRRVSLYIRGQGEAVRIQARTIPDLRLSPQTISDDDIKACAHLRDIEHLLTYDATEPGILLGQDNWHLLIPEEIRRGENHQPVASRLPLGWVLHGTHTHARRGPIESAVTTTL